MSLGDATPKQVIFHPSICSHHTAHPDVALPRFTNTKAAQGAPSQRCHSVNICHMSLCYFVGLFCRMKALHSCLYTSANPHPALQVFPGYQTAALVATRLRCLASAQETISPSTTVNQERRTPALSSDLLTTAGRSSKAFSRPQLSPIMMMALLRLALGLVGALVLCACSTMVGVQPNSASASDV